jgi:hypothetical protein
MMKLIPLPAFADNDRWMLNDGAKALAVDPVDAAAARAALDAQGFELAGILVTHSHAEARSPVVVACDRKTTLAPKRRSLAWRAALPPDTQPGRAPAPRLSNSRRATVVEPGNRDIGAHTTWRAARRAQRCPTQPPTIVDALRD